MAVQRFGLDRGIRIFTPNSQTEFVDILFVNGVPSGTGDSGEAPIGSLVMRTDTGDLYRKQANAGAPTDFRRLSSDEASDMFLGSALDIVTNGAIADGDSVEEALGKIYANQADLTTLSGVGQGAVNLGTFSGSVIQDNRNTKQALQDLETAIENISGGGKSQALGVTTATLVGGVLVDDAFQAEFEVVIEDAAAPQNRQSIKLNALHDGTAGADASTVDWTGFARNRIGSNFNYSLDVVLDGTGAAQQMAVQAQSSEPSGVNVYIRRTQLA